MRLALSPFLAQLRTLPHLVRQLWVRDYQDVKLIIEQSGDLRYFNIPARFQLVFARGTIIVMSVLVSSLLKRNLAKMFVSRTKDNIAGSYAVYALDSKRAYYLFGANDPALRDSSSGTAVLWDAFYPLAADGVAQVDLEGVNSPKRGWFKLSFGGELLPYYQASLVGV